MTNDRYISIVNDIKNFVFGPAKASVYGFGRNRNQKFVMSFTINIHIYGGMMIRDMDV